MAFNMCAIKAGPPKSAFTVRTTFHRVIELRYFLGDQLCFLGFRHFYLSSLNFISLHMISMWNIYCNGAPSFPTVGCGVNATHLSTRVQTAYIKAEGDSYDSLSILQRQFQLHRFTAVHCCLLTLTSLNSNLTAIVIVNSCL